MSLGPFSKASGLISKGMSLNLWTAQTSNLPASAYRGPIVELPLFGSAAAMKALEQCAPRPVHAVPTGIPASQASDLPRLWKSVMTKFYGPYDRKQKCWIGQRVQSGKTARYCMRPHKLEIVNTPSGKSYYLVIAGYETGKDIYHGAGGNVGFILLRDVDDDLSLLGKNSLYEEIGSYGRAPAEEDFHLEQLGPGQNYGWVVDTSFTNQGATLSAGFAYGLLGSDFRKLGRIPSGYDDAGICEDGKNTFTGGGCSSYTGRITFGPPAVGGFHTAIVNLKGVLNGKPVDQIDRYPFDPRKNEYSVPE